MYKIMLTIIITGLLVIFGMQNSNHVPVSFILGAPVQIRLVFLLSVAAGFGFMLSYIQGLSREIKLKRQIRKLTGLADSVMSQRSPRKAVNHD